MNALGMLVAGLAGFLPVAAHAGPCSMPAALQQICDDPELAKLEATLVAREAQVLKRSARPATWAARATSFRTALAAERDGDDKPLAREELRARIEGRIEEIDDEIARASAIVPVRDQAAVFGRNCVAKWLTMNCTVPAAGLIRDGELTILYQIQRGASERNGIGAGIVLWDASKPGALKPIGWTFEGVDVRTPQLDAESGLLWVPSTMMGTGEHNADMLFQKRGDRWVEIDMESWRDALDARLPRGIGAWKGVRWYFLGGAMGAETDLWAESDANCCPTAGSASLGFVIEGDRLKLDTVSAQLGGPKAEWKDL
jgi:hypothetical protein